MAGPYQQQVLFGSISNVSNGADAEIGTIRYYAGDEYRYVYNTGTNDVLPGHGVTVSGVGISGYSVVISSVSQEDVCLGVVKHATLSASCYGWVLTRGFVNVEMGLAVSCATCDPLMLGVSGVFVLASMTTSTPEQGVVCAKALVSMASGESGQAYVRAW